MGNPPAAHPIQKGAIIPWKIVCSVKSSRDIPSSKVYEDDLCYAFKRRGDPQAPTHFLVIPKQHIQSVAAVDASNSEDL